MVELTASEKAETARKACLDIIHQPKIANGAERNEKEGNKQPLPFSGATASRILAVLAEEKSTEGKILK